MKRIECDVLVLGAGIAGLTAAIHLADRGKKVVVVNRAPDPEESNTRYAQGGIIWWGDEDSTALLASDIDTAGDEIGGKRAIEILASEGKGLVESFLIRRLKVPFDSDGSGHFHRTSEAAHSRARIIHVKDKTGLAIQRALTHEANLSGKINLLADHTAVDLISTDHHTKKRGAVYDPTRILGAYVLDRNSGEIKTILASYTLLATGGVGAIFEYSTNPGGARGDGIAMAERAGARVINMEYVQFHPTAFRLSGSPSFLISEAVRGEGAILVNDFGERFMTRYNPERLELAPRDEVARAIFLEMAEKNFKNVWLDCAPIREKGVALEKRFPAIFEHCLPYGVDIRKDLIPVAPAAHYLCGGVRVDEWGRTNLAKLYAAGEVSCTGLHGANRLASTSLLEGLVWGMRSAEDIIGNFEKERFEDWRVPDWDESGVMEKVLSPASLQKYFLDIQKTMWQCAGIVRSEATLAKAWCELSLMDISIEEIYRRTKLSDDLIGARNALQSALLVVAQARRNKVSRGCHYREDMEAEK